MIEFIIFDLFLLWIIPSAYRYIQKYNQERCDSMSDLEKEWDNYSNSPYAVYKSWDE